MSDDSKLLYTPDFQKACLKYMMEEERFLIQCKAKLKAAWFEGKLAWVFSRLCEHNDSGIRVSRQVLLTDVSHFPVEKQQAYRDAVDSVLADNGIDLAYVKRELTAFIRANIFYNAYQESAELFNKKNLDSAYSLTRLKMEELSKASFEEDSIHQWGMSRQIIAEASQIQKTCVPTGLDAIDTALGGGMLKGTLTTLLAAQNAGKSTSLKNIAYHAIINGHKVCMIVHEDERRKTIMQMIARMTKIQYNRLRAGVLTPQEWAEVDKATAILDKMLVLKFMYGFDTYIEDVYDYAKLKKKEFDFDLLVDDYAQLLQTKKQTEGLRFSQTVVFRGLAQLAGELDVAVLTPAQGNREAQKTSKKGLDFLRSTDISECFEIARVSSNIITINRSEQDEAANRMVFFLDKNREGPVNIAVETVTDFSRCVTHDSSLGQKQLAGVVPPMANLPVALDNNGITSEPELGGV